MTSILAKSLIKNEAHRLCLVYGKITARTVYFDGSPAPTVTIRDATPNPLYDDLARYARSHKIVLSVYVDGVAG
jgi:hypothetical protein